MILDILLGLVVVLAGAWLRSIELKLRTIDRRLRDVPNRKEVNEQIDIKTESVKVLQQEIKEDVKEIKIKLDHIIEIELSKRN